MSLQHAWALGLLAVACSSLPGPDPTSFEAPRSPARIIAGWEPALGAFISWPLDVPDAVVLEIAEDDIVYLLVRPDARADAETKMAELGIATPHVEVIECLVESSWPRDWGPHQLVFGGGQWGLVDQDFQGYPSYPDGYGLPGDPSNDEEITIYPTGPGDDGVVDEIAAYFGAPSFDLGAHLTGGNFLVDGHGTAFCTRAQLLENADHFDETGWRKRVRQVTGTTNIIVLENTEPKSIQHIDCWLKPLDERRLLVKRPPPGHPEEAAIERNIEKLASLHGVFGEPYEIVRIDCPPIPHNKPWENDDPIAAYTNSLILNHKVLVPLYGIPGDARALEQWRAAMPDYEVIGFEWDGWISYDALHCRSRAVFVH
jgi:agmatine/peptidylarginine deiminase